jgi:hypothetical protein
MFRGALMWSSVVMIAMRLLPMSVQQVPHKTSKTRQKVQQFSAEARSASKTMNRTTADVSDVQP